MLAPLRVLRSPVDEISKVHALARRMGVQDVKFDCHAWSWMDSLGDYSYRYHRNDELRHGLDRARAHAVAR